MYSRYSGQIPPDTRIPGNYSGNALRRQNFPEAAPSGNVGQPSEARAAASGNSRAKSMSPAGYNGSSFPAYSADIPGFYRQAPRSAPEQSHSPHVSYSPLAGTLNVETRIPAPDSQRLKEESREGQQEREPHEREPRAKEKNETECRDDADKKENCRLCREDRDNTEKKPDNSGFRWFPAGDDLLLLGLLILLIQSKGNEELALIIAMLLIIH